MEVMRSRDLVIRRIIPIISKLLGHHEHGHTKIFNQQVLLSYPDECQQEWCRNWPPESFTQGASLGDFLPPPACTSHRMGKVGPPFCNAGARTQN